MKFKLFITAAVACLAALALCLTSSEYFLPWLRYCSASNWSVLNAIYYTSLGHSEDSTYFFSVAFGETAERVPVPWLGDTVRQFANLDGYLKPGAFQRIMGFDTSVLTFSGDHVAPKRCGNYACHSLIAKQAGHYCPRGKDWGKRSSHRAARQASNVA